MMRWVVASSLKFRRLVVAAAAGVMILGITQLGGIEKDIVPEFSPPTVEVQTEALGLSASEVEQLVTVPLEHDLLASVAFLDTIESASLPGLSSVVMTFEPGTPILDARQVVTEQLTQIGALPHVSKPPQMIQPVSSTSRVAMIRMSSDELSAIEMSVLARWVIEPRLLGVDGVANVAIWGQRERQLQVQVDPRKLAKADVPLMQVVATTGNALEVSPLSFLEASTPGTGGFIDTVNQRLQIFHEQAITTPAELASVPLEPVEGVPASDETRTLGDVAKVVEGHQPLIGDALCRDQTCLMLVVEKFPDTSTLHVSEGVDEAIAALKPGLPGVEMDATVYRPAAFIEASTQSYGWALAVGGFLAIVFLFVIAFRWRAALVASTAIVLSLLAAALVLALAEVRVDLMVAAGLLLALAVLVDDAVVDVGHAETKIRSHRRGETGTPMWRTVARAALDTRTPLLYATFIIAIALTPVLFLRNEAGAFLPSIASTYILAIAVSLLVALTVTPALGMMLLAKGPLAAREPLLPRLLRRRWADERKSRGLGHTGAAFAVIGGVLVIGLATIPFLDAALRPDIQERDVLVKLEAPPGTSLASMDESTIEAVEDLAALPGVSDAGAHVGRAIRSDQVVNVNSSEVWAKLDPSADYDATIDAIEQTTAGYGDVSADVLTYSEQRVADVLNETESDVVVRVYGTDSEALRETAEEISGRIAGVEGITEPTVEAAVMEPTLEIEVDLEKAQRIGVSPGEVRRSAAILLSGLNTGNLFEDQKVFDVVVWGTPQIRQNKSDVEDLLIDTPSGGHVALGEVADVRLAPNESVILHESVSKYLDVSASVEGRSVVAVSADVESAVDQIAFPVEHHAELLGGYAERRAADLGLLAALVAAAIGIYLLLQAAFSSWRLATLVFLALPLAIVGGLVVIAADGGAVTLGAVGGLVAIFGLTTRSSILLVRNYQRLTEDAQIGGPELVARGTRERMAPVATTAIAIALVVAPFLFWPNATGFEIVRPMAAVILGGLVTSTLLTLVALPALYLRFGASASRDTSTENLIVEIPEVEEVRG